MKYECHITLDPKDLAHGAKIAGYIGGWHSSVIDGDEDLPGKNAFLTKSIEKKPSKLVKEAKEIIRTLAASNVLVKRVKIEKITYDCIFSEMYTSKDY